MATQKPKMKEKLSVYKSLIVEQFIFNEKKKISDTPIILSFEVQIVYNLKELLISWLQISFLKREYAYVIAVI